MTEEIKNNQAEEQEPEKEMTLKEALDTLEVLSVVTEGAIEQQKPLFGNAKVFVGRREIMAINTIKRYFAERMDELE